MLAAPGAIKLKVLAIARASRNKTESGKQKLQQSYVALLNAASCVVGQARQFSREIGSGIKRGSKKVLGKVKRQLDEMIPRLQQVLFQTRQRVLYGNTRATGSWSASSSPRPKSSAKARRTSPTSLASWSRFRKPRTRSSPVTRSWISGQPTPLF